MCSLPLRYVGVTPMALTADETSAYQSGFQGSSTSYIPPPLQGEGSGVGSASLKREGRGRLCPFPLRYAGVTPMALTADETSAYLSGLQGSSTSYIPRPYKGRG